MVVAYHVVSVIVINIVETFALLQHKQLSMQLVGSSLADLLPTSDSSR